MLLYASFGMHKQSQSLTAFAEISNVDPLPNLCAFNDIQAGTIISLHLHMYDAQNCHDNVTYDNVTYDNVPNSFVSHAHNEILACRILGKVASPYQQRRENSV